MKIVQCLFLVVFFSASISAYPSKHIKGVVVDSKYPVIGANITLKNESKVKHAETDFDGNFLFNIESKLTRMRILVQYPGYYPIDTIIEMTKNDTSFYKFILTEQPPFNYLAHYNKKTAIHDIKKKKYQILQIGLVFADEAKIMRKITRKYGFQYLNLGDVDNSGGEMEKAQKEYNDVVYKYLDAKNKKGWEEQMRGEINSAIKKLIYSKHPDGQISK